MPCSSPRRPELMQPHAVLEFGEEHLNRHPVAHRVWRNFTQIGDEPGALFQFDQRHDHRIPAGVDRGMARDDIAVNAATAARTFDPPLQGMTVGTHRAGRMAQLKALRTALKAQLAGRHAVPEELIVVRSERCSAFHGAYASLPAGAVDAAGWRGGRVIPADAFGSRPSSTTLAAHNSSISAAA